MCDYSLHAVRNRLAVQGESLYVHKFHTGSKGLASEADFRALTNITPALEGTGLFGRLRHWVKEFRRVGTSNAARDLPAVCIPPGAKLYVAGIPDRIRADYALSDAEEATFTQLTSEPFRYRDAFRFPNGAEVLVQKFDEETSVEVLALALAEDPKTEPGEVEEPTAHVSYEQALGRSRRANV